MASAYFYNPQNRFMYVDDRTLWNIIFKNPIPKNFEDTSMGFINLSSYFNTKYVFIDTYMGYYRETREIYPKDIYYEIDKDERDLVFMALCAFLIRYRRPYIACCINVNRHKEVALNEDYHPLNFFYSEPQYPVIENRRLRVLFFGNRKLYEDLHYYSIGKKDEEIDEQNLGLCYEAKGFQGFVLQY